MVENAFARISWSRLGAESLIIVLSILLALGVDEWREDRNEREFERDYLVRLVDDLNANIGQLEIQAQSDVRKVANARAIYSLISRGDMADLDISAIAIASYLATPSDTPNWVDDTFEELKSTGRLSLITSTEVRKKLSAYYRYLEVSDWTYQLMSTEYRAAIRARMDPDLQLAIRSECRSRDPGKCQLDIATPDIEEYVQWLSSNQMLADGLRRVIVQWTRGEKEYLPTVKQKTDEMKRLIEQELARL